ncbi:MAG: UDP-N-acetylmuramate--L-alanine ligase [Candidatus Omnitrophica bacterium]|nr:UDP-N-acetylmuramate--L-alanine ligase [Candidatus Omnitrophota bacterium]
MIGIGGIGMSGLAFILKESGCRVSGSDVVEGSIVKKLRRKGIIVNIGHDKSYIKDQDIVVYSSSIRMNNPEILAAQEKKILIISRIELLKTVMDGNIDVVAVAGTHGKTTITAMVSLLLEEAGADPTVLIGGESPHFGGNAKSGKSKTLVAEVDESDGRFVILKATHIIMPNLEKEHLEHYQDEAHLANAFRKFLAGQSSRSTFFYKVEDRRLRKLAKIFKGKTVSFGFSEEADVYAANVKIDTFKILFDCFKRGEKIGRFALNMPGVHNVLNAVAVIALGIEFGIGFDTMKRALSGYKGVKRRFELIGDVGGAKIVEDYAHHPTEIKATISAAYSLKPERLITVFQPHRYTRTKSFYKEFSASFAGSDEVILTEVYPASEDKIKGASSRSIYEIMLKDRSIPVKLLDKDKIPKYLSGKLKRGDLVLIMGAGDIGGTAPKLLQEMKKRNEKQISKGAR